MTIHALAFDLDGTLCDTLPDLAAAANATRVASGLAPLPVPRIESYVGDGIPRLVHRLLLDAREGDAPAVQHAAAYQYFTDYYRDHLCVASRLYDGVAATLAVLRARNLPLAVITNKNEALARRLLADLHIAEHFALIYGGDTLPEKKPAPLPLITAAEALGVAPAQMLMVGDSANDILAAKAAGCPVAAVTFGYADTRRLHDTPATRANYLIDQFAALLDLV